MSLLNLYEATRQSFRAHTAQMNVAGQNVANAGNPDYARRRLTASPQALGGHGLTIRPGPSGGMGVTAGSYERLRDGLLENAGREALSGFAGSSERARLLSALEGTFGADGTRLTDAFGGFFQAFADLAAGPTEPAARQAALARADGLAATFRRLDADLAALASETQRALGTSVSEANGLLAQLAALDEPIRTARAAGAPDLDAEEQRDRLLGALAGFLPLQIADGPDGLRVASGGLVLVQGGTAQALRLAAPPEAAAHRVEVNGHALPGEGSLGAQAAVLAGPLAGARTALDTLAADFVAQANALHAEGFGLDGGTGRALFSGSGAASIRLALADPAHLAASGSGAAGDNAAALALGALREAFDPRAARLATGIGEQLRSARTEARAQGALVDHLGALAGSVSAVSIDEEMTRLIETQQAFAASARVLQTVEQMMETLLRL